VIGAAIAVGAYFGALPSVDMAPARTTFVVEGYPLDNSPQAAAAFPGNKVVLLAVVEATLDPAWVNASRAAPDAAAFIYTPIRVRVLEVLRGAPRLQSGTLIVRHLGGRIGDTEYVFSDEMAPLGLDPGNLVLLFLGEQRDLGDGRDGVTPNMLYVVDRTGIARSSDQRWSLDIGAFQALIRK
jgi:hypothetical protein